MGVVSRLQVPLWLEQARRMMDKEFRNGLTSAFIARSVGVHPVYLAQVFRRAYGCSISEYLCRRRLEYACFELRGSNTSIAIIAIEAGFYDQGHFSRTFKRLYGITPSEYRRRYGR